MHEFCVFHPIISKHNYINTDHKQQVCGMGAVNTVSQFRLTRFYFVFLLDSNSAAGDLAADHFVLMFTMVWAPSPMVVRDRTIVWRERITTMPLPPCCNRQLMEDFALGQWPSSVKQHRQLKKHRQMKSNRLSGRVDGEYDEKGLVCGQFNVWGYFFSGKHKNVEW